MSVAITVTPAWADTEETSSSKPSGQAVQLRKIAVHDKKTGPQIGEEADPAYVEGQKHYVVTHSSTGSRVETRTIDVPQDIVVISKKLIEDQDLRNITSAISNVAGVSSSTPGYFPLDQMSSLYIRGFQVSATLRDGLWDPTPFGNSWMGDVDHVEVLKGPAGLLNGAFTGGIGGLINIVTKKPSKKATYSGNVEFDSFGSKIGRIDISQPLSKDGKWLMRVNLEEGEYNSFAHNTSSEKRGGSVVFQGQLSDHDTLTLSFEKRWQRADAYSGLPGFVATGSGAQETLVALPHYSKRLNVEDPRSSWDFNSTTGRIAWEHAFGADWSFRSSSQYTTTSRNMLSIYANPTLSGNNVVYHQAFSNILMGPVNAVDTDNVFHGKSSIFGHQNDLIFGERYTRDWFDMNMHTTTNSFSQYSFTNPWQANWGQPINGLHRMIRGDSEMQQFNTYVNDVFSITKKLKLTGGFNWVRYDTYSESGMIMNGMQRPMSGTGKSASGFSWRAGLIYEIIPNVAFFGDYSTTFQPQDNNATDDGVIQRFSPLSGEQGEAGIKADIADRASITAALYRTTMRHQTMTDPDPTKANLGYETDAGQEQSQGVEVDATLNLAPGWDMLASYSYTDARITKSSDYVQGSRVPNVPEHSFQLWSVYEFQKGILKGLGLGAGVHVASSRTTNLVSAATPHLYAQIGAYDVFNATAYYKINRHWKFSMNINNIFDKHYTESAASYNWLYPGSPPSAVFRLSVTY